MPSLRRTVSSPSVRASPYPVALSSAQGLLSSGAPRLGPRRTVSETCRRRVLADIEWWRVLDGQHREETETELDPELAEDQDQDSRQLGRSEVDAGVVVGAHVVQLLRPSTPPVHHHHETATTLVIPQGSSEALSITSPFAALSISAAFAPATPPRPRHSRDASDSSTSSAESSPEPSPRDVSYEEALDGFTELPFTSSSLSRAHSLYTMRTELPVPFPFVDFSTPKSATDDRFSDVVFL